MKVGTDGVLLGAWADAANARKILDVGTGTGLIALMMAQRTEAEITAIEIEKNSFNEACFNFGQSPWANRIRPVHQSFQEFCATSGEKFNLIISNPPFFENASKAADLHRSNARHTDLLPYSELIAGSFNLLEKQGKLAVIIPELQAGNFIALARETGLFISKLARVKPKPGKPFHRELILFSKEESIPGINELAIEFETHHHFTDEYKNLTKDFYLLF